MLLPYFVGDRYYFLAGWSDTVDHCGSGGGF